MTATARAASGLVGVGYEGRDIGTFVKDLVAEGVTHLVDVRLTPISRKPGFSKTALSEALAKADIVYDHRPELGNPKLNRAGFAGSSTELERARRKFAAGLRRPAAEQALNTLAELARSARVAVLCFEADQARCHRDVVLMHAQEREDQYPG